MILDFCQVALPDVACIQALRDNKGMDKSPSALKPRQTNRSLPMALLRARETVMAHFRPMLERHDVTEQQWRVLRIVAENKSLDASEVAERAAILAPSLTRIIKALEQRKLIRRRQDSQDKRRVMLEIAPAGLVLIAQAVPESLAAHKAVEDQFGKDRVEQLLDLLDFVATKPR
jgi:homoprotocatechuate degradation regulator HpaR